jgi:hypothetical protein
MALAVSRCKIERLLRAAAQVIRPIYLICLLVISTRLLSALL